MFDTALFIKIILWIVAGGATVAALGNAGYHYYYRHTEKGGRELLYMMMYHGVIHRFNWSTVAVAVIAWIAIYCMR